MWLNFDVNRFERFIGVRGIGFKRKYIFTKYQGEPIKQTDGYFIISLFLPSDNQTSTTKVVVEAHD